MAKVNTGNRTPAQNAEAAEALKAEAAAEGKIIVEEGGATYAVTESFGLTIKTRIA